MPKIVYYGPHREVEFMGVVCAYGEPVVFPADIANRALAQDTWTTPADAPDPDAAPLGVVDYDNLPAAPDERN